MSREISEDFKNLISFFNNYSISKIVADVDYVTVISKVHKRYFVYLTVVGEITLLSKDTSLFPNIGESQNDYLKESASDIGNAIFSLINGSYKSANLMLRSSIETFLKGFNLDVYSDITTEKSLYKIFDTVKTLQFYQNEPQKQLFNLIHQKYIDLCAETHTASALNMAHITSMNYFPRFDKAKAVVISDTITQLINWYSSLIVLKYNQHFHKMHFKNKTNISSILSGNIKRIIQGIDQ
ncbi:hypothetical protein [Sphingobacterium kitahiroshimense]|uniref:Uncharacterized protein n=1 Tax=Sphingobacterium kitahiroshimense TaxID=470446 RepID=A0ABV0C2D7_9SPHI